MNYSFILLFPCKVVVSDREFTLKQVTLLRYYPLSICEYQGDKTIML